MKNIKKQTRKYSEVIKMRAIGHVDVYCYYDDVESTQLVTAERDGRVVAYREYSSDEDLCDDLGGYDPYDDISQGEAFLDKHYRA